MENTGIIEYFYTNICDNVDSCVEKKCTVKPSTNRTKSEHLNVSRHVLQLPLPNPSTPLVKSRMKMSGMLQLYLSDPQFCFLVRCEVC